MTPNQATLSNPLLLLLFLPLRLAAPALISGLSAVLLLVLPLLGAVHRLLRPG